LVLSSLGEKLYGVGTSLRVETDALALAVLGAQRQAHFIPPIVALAD